MISINFKCSAELRISYILLVRQFHSLIVLENNFLVSSRGVGKDNRAVLMKISCWILC